MSSRYLLIASAALVLAGTGMIAVYGYHLYASSSGHREGIDAFAAAKAAREQATQPSQPSATDLLPPVEVPAESTAARDAPDTRDWSEARLAAYDAHADEESLPEGVLRIPGVRLEVPVFTGTGEAALSRGAGRIEGTPPLGTAGNTGIAAHRDGYFRALKDVAVGDEIRIETLDGVHDYRITELSIVEPEDVYVLAPTARDSLTLVTCYPFYFVGAAPQRFIVRAERS